MTPWPRFSAPLELAVSAPTDRLPSVNAPALATWAAPPVSVTVPPSWLPALPRLMAAPPLLTLKAPDTLMAAFWLSGPPVVSAIDAALAPPSARAPLL